MQKIPLKMRTNLFFLAFFSINTFSLPWIDTYDYINKYKLDSGLSECGNININTSNSYPLALGEVYYLISSIERDDNLSHGCKEQIFNLKSYIQNEINKGTTKIGYQNGHDDIYFQELGKRYYKNPSIYIQHSKVYSQFVYNIRIAKDLEKNETYFDESFITYRLKNQTISLGRKSRWWSPSKSDSLILSNASRPQLGIELKNFVPIEFNNYLRFLGGVNYEIFVNRLEKDRHISEALLFGSRISVNPSNNLNISLIRLAQFGGKDRPTDSRTIINMLLGRDNSNANGSFEEPGNQIAGLDFKYLINKKNNLTIYGQMIGEDEAGYFPSRKFYLYGSSFDIFIKNRPLNMSINYLDTFSGIKNYTYNHPIYKDGLRYLDMPLGASIDSDSNKFSITMFREISEGSNIKLSIKNISLNENLSEQNTWTQERLDFNELEMAYNFELYGVELSFIYLHRDKVPGLYKKKNFVFNFEYKI